MRFMYKYKLNIYEIEEKETLALNVIDLKDKVEAILKSDDAKSDVPAACFEENDDTPLAIAYKKANGEIIFYYPE